MCTCSSSCLWRCSMLAWAWGAVCALTAAARVAPPNADAAISTSSACSRFPAAVMTMLFGAYHEWKHSRSVSRENCGTVSGVPRIGRPRGCPRQKFCVNISWITLSGLSSSILISSRTTCFSLAMSASSNRGRNTRSESTSKATGKCSSSTFALKQVISFAVKASSIPPSESIDCAISSAVRRSVPLNTMCSMKWAIPLLSGDSPREPVPTQMPTDTERTCGIFSVTTTRPFGNSARSISRTGWLILLFWHRSRSNATPCSSGCRALSTGGVGHIASCQGFSRTGTLYPEPLRGAAYPPGLWRNRAGQPRVSVLLGKFANLPRACLIEKFDRRTVEFKFHGSNQIVQLFNARGADDRRGDAGTRKQPRQRHPCRRGIMFFCDLIQRLKNLEAAFVEILLQHSGARSFLHIAFRSIFAGEKSASQGKVIDDADSFLLAQRLKLSLVIRAVVEVVIGLKALVPEQARLLADFERRSESIRRKVGSADGPHFALRD